MILAIGYRVRSPRGIPFIKYASTVLKDYLIKGFAIQHNTASEVIYKRVDSNKEFIGLTTFKRRIANIERSSNC